VPPNHLIHEKSPYLIQHADNPVNWHPWSEEAFNLAKTEDKPVFLSIGYATCHWCHVMEKESFEDDETARYLNDTFVCIKVDREERPDIDAVYMAVCQMLTGSGGWPLTIFMTPKKEAFFAATYLPKQSQYGRAGLIDLCQQVKKVWRHEQEKIEKSVQAIQTNLAGAFAFSPAEVPGASLIKQTYRQITNRFDSRYGGFGPPPKFPTPHRLLFLLRYHHKTRDPAAWNMVEQTLAQMRMGGIWDHVGYGFHRYSTDERWLLPHFEKMLYDQALLAIAYLEAYQISRRPQLAQTAEEIFSYVLRDMTSPAGGFYSAEDADSEGEEGKFYVWTTEAFRRIAGPDAARRWEPIFRLAPEGNFAEEATGRKTGGNILHLTAPFTAWADKLGIPTEELVREWKDLSEKLFRSREKRIHPLKDDKILTDWNGLMIAALAQGSRILSNPGYERAASRAAQFILQHMQDKRGRLYHRFREGHVTLDAQASDYAFLIFGLLNLYQSTCDVTYAEEAARLQETMVEDFWDETHGGFFSTPLERTDLPVRPKELYDSAIPSANSVSLFNLTTLFKLTGDPLWNDRAHAAIKAFSGTVASQPEAFAFFLCALDRTLSPGQEVVVAGERERPKTKKFLDILNRDFAPNRIVVFKSEQNAERISRFAPYTEPLQVPEDTVTAHVCSNGACSLSIDSAEALARQLRGD